MFEKWFKVNKKLHYAHNFDSVLHLRPRGKGRNIKAEQKNEKQKTVKDKMSFVSIQSVIIINSFDRFVTIYISATGPLHLCESILFG